VRVKSRNAFAGAIVCPGPTQKRAGTPQEERTLIMANPQNQGNRQQGGADKDRQQQQQQGGNDRNSDRDRQQGGNDRQDQQR
jgi:hypothetical protein